MTGNHMKSALALALALAMAGTSWSPGAYAQAPQSQAVARLKQVTGSVLVSREAGMSAGNQDQRLMNGTRIITTANSEAIVLFDNGCEVRVPENHRFDVDSDKPCALLLAEALAPAPSVAALGPGLLPLLLVPAGVGAILIADRKQPSVSPN